jgi:hypothetical protein
LDSSGNKNAVEDLPLAATIIRQLATGRLHHTVSWIYSSPRLSAASLGILIESGKSSVNWSIFLSGFKLIPQK